MTFKKSKRPGINRGANLICILSERILRWVWQALWLIVADFIVSHADVLENFVNGLSEVTECNCTVVRIILLNQYVTVEAAHFLDCEYTDSTEGLSSYVKNFTLCNVCTKDVIRCGLQTEECDIARKNIAFESTVGNFDREISCHDLLVLHLAESKLAGACAKTS